MDQKIFNEILERYQSGDATEEEQKLVEQWYALIEEHPRPLNAEEWDRLGEKLWLNLSYQAFGNQPSGRRLNSRSLWRKYPIFRIAAVFVILFSFVLIFQTVKRYSSNNVPEDYFTEITTEVVKNSSDKEKTISLSDGSSVTLEPGSELHFPVHFNSERREVLLIGEAFFEIQKRASSPFLVYAGQLTTKVLGTSFRVKAKSDGSEVEVSVKTGSVSVFEKISQVNPDQGEHEKGIVLTPNQQVRFTQEDRRFVTGLVSDPEIIIREVIDGKPVLFDYYDTNLSEVLEDLSEAYKIQINLQKKSLEECPLTANLRDKTLFVQLDLICAAIRGNYKVNGTTIVIDGIGCD